MDAIIPVGDAAFEHAAQVLADGGLVVIPTDTIYGIVADPRNPQAIARLYAAKRRPAAKSLQVLFDTVDAIPRAGLILPSVLRPLADAFLPGPLSPICLAGPGCVLATVRESDGTQAVRVPDSDAVRRLVALFGSLACSSANISGQSSALTARDAERQLSDSVALYLDGGPAPGGLSSTIVAADAASPDGVAVLRDGALGEAAVRAVLRARAARARETGAGDRGGGARA